MVLMILLMILLAILGLAGTTCNIERLKARPRNDMPCPHALNATQDEQNILDRLLNYAHLIQQWLNQNQPNSIYTQNINHYWNGRIVKLDPISPDEGGEFNGCINIQLDGYPSTGDYVLPQELLESRLVTRLVHELAHAAAGPGTGHYKPFADANNYLAHIAADQLGLPVALTCGGGCQHSGICNRFWCKKCTWVKPNPHGTNLIQVSPEECGPYMPGP